jgi:hypothetical protein
MPLSPRPLVDDFVFEGVRDEADFSKWVERTSAIASACSVPLR